MLHQILLVFSFVCFVIAAIPGAAARVNLIAIGLACLVAAELLAGR